MISNIAKLFDTRRRHKLKKGECYFFLHIPKTAGTTFRHMCYAYFRDRQILPNQNLIIDQNQRYLSQKEFIDSKFISKIPKQYKFFMGHYNFQVINQLLIKPEIITIIREPKKRTISHIQHLKKSNPKYKSASPTDIIDDLKGYLTNLQLRMLGFNKSKKSIENFAIEFHENNSIGISENFDAFINQLNQKYNWELKTIEAKNKTNLSDSSFECSHEDLIRIDRMTTEDQIFYKAICELTA